MYGKYPIACNSCGKGKKGTTAKSTVLVEFS